MSSLTATQVFGNNVGARLAYEHDTAAWTDGTTVTPKAVESWYRSRQVEAEPEVTTVNEGAANIFWRGTSSVAYSGHAYKPTQSEKITLGSGATLYKGWYRESMTWTLWLGNNENYRWVLSIERGEVVVRLWRNIRNHKWCGRIVNSTNTGDWQCPSAERLATAWVIVGADAVLNDGWRG